MDPHPHPRVLKAPCPEDPPSPPPQGLQGVVPPSPLLYPTPRSLRYRAPRTPCPHPQVLEVLCPEDLLPPSTPWSSRTPCLSPPPLSSRRRALKFPCPPPPTYVVEVVVGHRAPRSPYPSPPGSSRHRAP
uniref:Uncharacterized protein n=1 Tax=Solanum lycopersicum TaxID=4081 RepID=A0A3Q7FQU9_SOLLC